MTVSASHDAVCSCGQLRVRLAGAPFLVSSCHCLACQRRTGSLFGANSFFKRAQAAIEGASKSFRRQADSGNWLDFHFCPDCGSTVYWDHAAGEETVAVAVGAFADPGFPPPTISVYALRRHPWVVEGFGYDAPSRHVLTVTLADTETAQCVCQFAERAANDLRGRERPRLSLE